MTSHLLRESLLRDWKDQTSTVPASPLSASTVSLRLTEAFVLHSSLLFNRLPGVDFNTQLSMLLLLDAKVGSWPSCRSSRHGS